MTIAYRLVSLILTGWLVVLVVGGCSKTAHLPTEEFLIATPGDPNQPINFIVGFTDSGGEYHDYQGVVVAVPLDSLTFSIPGQPDSTRVLATSNVRSISFQAADSSDRRWLAGALITAIACVWIASWDTTWE